jgi:hypothetical protein
MCVPRKAWKMIAKLVGFELGMDYESIVKMLLCNKRFRVVNLINSAVCWGLWKLRNCLCFQEMSWTSIKALWHTVIHC